MIRQQSPMLSARTERSAAARAGGRGRRYRECCLVLFAVFGGPAWPEADGQAVSKPPAASSETARKAMQALQMENAALKKQLVQMQELRDEMAARAKDLGEISARLHEIAGAAQSVRAERATFQKQIETLNQTLEASQHEAAACARRTPGCRPNWWPQVRIRNASGPSWQP